MLYDLAIPRLAILLMTLIADIHILAQDIGLQLNLQIFLYHECLVLVKKNSLSDIIRNIALALRTCL
jgi:hypothetical protein